LRGWLETESEVEFPSPAFCQVESFPHGILQIGLRDGNLQAHRFNRRPVLDGVLGFVGSVFCIHGICFCCLVFSCMFGENATKQVHFVYGGEHPMRAAIVVLTSGGQPPSRREGGRTARPAKICSGGH
jgi:hypothetical protein